MRENLRCDRFFFQCLISASVDLVLTFGQKVSHVRRLSESRLKRIIRFYLTIFKRLISFLKSRFFP